MNPLHTIFLIFIGIFFVGGLLALLKAENNIKTKIENIKSDCEL
jgi:hypothetical protein